MEIKETPNFTKNPATGAYEVVVNGKVFGQLTFGQVAEPDKKPLYETDYTKHGHVKEDQSGR